MRYQLDEAFVEATAKFPPFEPDYGAYSAKAIKKLLPLMRMGHHWHSEDIDEATQQRIQRIIDGEVDEGIRQRVREKAIHLSSIEQFHGLQIGLA